MEYDGTILYLYILILWFLKKVMVKLEFFLFQTKFRKNFFPIILIHLHTRFIPNDNK